MGRCRTESRKRRARRRSNGRSLRVEAVESRLLLATYYVTNTGDLDANNQPVPGSLRDAILQANGNPGFDQIQFNIPSSGGVQTIRPTASLPTITDPVFLDATTQPGYDPNVALPAVEIDGSLAGPGVNGLTIDTDGSTVQGLAINRFSGSGVVIGPFSGNNLQSNLIGLAASGESILANGGDGIVLDGSSNSTIGARTGGPRALARLNVVSGNRGNGIVLRNGASNNLIIGNRIGTDFTGTVALGNGQNGLLLNAALSNTIGGAITGVGNVISGNLGSGIVLSNSRPTGSGQSGNLVQGNFIGTDLNGTSPLGNSGQGVLIQNSSFNAIGGDALEAGNIIEYNGGNGVTVLSGTNNQILTNAIDSNGGLGIDLGGDGPTPNDPQDPDSGPNNLQNYPVLVSAVVGTETTDIHATLNSTPNSTFLIQFFASPAPDPSGFGEGRTFLGETYVTTDASGNVDFTATVSTPPSDQSFISATATDSQGNTSEFSGTRALGPDLATTAAGTPNPVPVAGLLTYNVTITNKGLQDAVNAFSGNALPVGVDLISVVPSQGTITSYNPATGFLRIDLGTLAPSAQATITITVQPTTAGTLHFVAGAGPNDGNPNNNFAFVNTQSIYTFTVTNTNDSGLGSLRQVLLNANAHPGPDTIDFKIPGPGPHVIQPYSELPTLTDSGTTIDGTTQPGFVDQPVVEIRGDRIGSGQYFLAATTTGVDGLVALGSSITIRSLSITRFSGRAIALLGGGEDIIAGCDLGTNASGASGLGNGVAGLWIEGSSYNRIGGPNARDRNVISGNGGNGLAIVGGQASHNLLWGNRIGTTPDGTSALPNVLHGVALVDTSNNTIGGVGAGQGNLISGNEVNGIEVVRSSNVGIFGNVIGLDATGTRALGNSGGVSLEDQTSGVSVGAPVAGAGNVVSGNINFGVQTNLSANGNLIAGNKIGTDAAGTKALGNGLAGVVLSASSNNIVGWTTPVGSNLVSGNGESQVIITGPSSSGNQIFGNRIGTNASGNAALGQAQIGVFVNGSPGNQIGGSQPGQGNLISGSVVGVELVGPGASRNAVQGNLIGTDVTGQRSIGNRYGVMLRNASANTIGGTASGQGNLISGNAVIGVWLFGAGSTSNVVQGNGIGVNLSRDRALPNGAVGVYLDGASGNQIGGSQAGAGNVVSGNRSVGIQLNGAASGSNLIQGNYVGTNAAGNAAIGNGIDGIFVDKSPGNQILDNLISGNGSAGLQVLGPGTSGNQMLRNTIGLAADRVTPLGNAFGVFLNNAQGITLPQTGPDANRISGNTQANVISTAPGANANTPTAPILTRSTSVPRPTSVLNRRKLPARRSPSVRG